MTSEEFADVTLVTDDRKQFRAHRNILSAFSPVFKNILQIDINSPNSVIYLNGIQCSEIESILQFIYLGEARFYEERMSEFLSVSKCLKIKELEAGIEFNADAQTPEKNNKQGSNVAVVKETLHPPKINEDNADTVISEDHVLSAEEEGSNKVNQRKQNIVSNNKETKLQCKECKREFKSYQALMFHVKSIHEGVKYACNHCDHLATTPSNLTAHIKSKHVGVKYACIECDQKFSQKAHLRTHIQSIHKCVKYACDQCDKKFTRQDRLITHIQSIHEGIMYACNQCDQQYTEQRSLTLHIENKHEGVKYACNQCDYKLGSINGLRYHIRTKH